MERFLSLKKIFLIYLCFFEKKNILKFFFFNFSFAFNIFISVLQIIGAGFWVLKLLGCHFFCHIIFLHSNVCLKGRRWNPLSSILQFLCHMIFLGFSGFLLIGADIFNVILISYIIH
jgi:hypothetical protein